MPMCACGDHLDTSHHRNVYILSPLAPSPSAYFHTFLYHGDPQRTAASVSLIRHRLDVEEEEWSVAVAEEV